MKLFARLGSYSLVGLFATAVHAVALVLMGSVSLSPGLANAMSYLVAFMASFLLQQRYTFRDKLKGERLTLAAGVLIVAANLALGYCLGAWLPAAFVGVLPLVPALVNYGLYASMTSLRSFKTPVASRSSRHVSSWLP